MLQHWGLVELDLQQYFGIDVGSGILRERTWRWGVIRVVGLLSTRGSRIQRVLNPTPDERKARAQQR